MTSIPTPFSITVDTTGDYDTFVKGLEKVLPTKIKKGEIRFVLHSDEDQELYVPRKTYKKSKFDVFVNTVSIDDLEHGVSPVHHHMAGLLKDRVKSSGYYIIWESADRINLVPGTSKTPKFSKGFGN